MCRLLIPYLKIIGRNYFNIFDPFIKEIYYPFDGKHFTNEKDIKKYVKDCDAYIVAIGGENGKEREEISEFLRKDHKLKSLSLLHHNSYLCESSSVGYGLIMMPGSVINSFTKVGNNSIFNTNSSVDHECHIGNGVHIMGGAVVTGRVCIEDYATIGSNATILPDLKIGRGAFVGAGAVVTKDVSINEIVIGNPSRPLKKS